MIKKYPLPQDSISVIDDKIYHNDKLFAELRYFHRYGSRYRGLAIYYYPHKKEVWIFPEEGWRIIKEGKEYTGIQEMEKVWQEYEEGVDEWSEGRRSNRPFVELLFRNRHLSDEEAKITAWCFDAKISEDGKYVYYKSQGFFFGFFFDSSHKYLVEYGISK